MPYIAGFKPERRLDVVVNQEHMWVRELFIGDGKRWDERQVRRLFTHASAEAILQIRVPVEAGDDTYF